MEPRGMLSAHFIASFLFAFFAKSVCLQPEFTWITNNRHCQRRVSHMGVGRVLYAGGAPVQSKVSYETAFQSYCFSMVLFTRRTWTPRAGKVHAKPSTLKYKAQKDFIRHEQRPDRLQQSPETDSFTVLIPCLFCLFWAAK